MGSSPAQGTRYAGQAHLLYGGSDKEAEGTIYVLSAILLFSFGVPSLGVVGGGH